MFKKQKILKVFLIGAVIFFAIYSRNFVRLDAITANDVSYVTNNERVETLTYRDGVSFNQTNKVQGAPLYVAEQTLEVEPELIIELNEETTKEEIVEAVEEVKNDTIKVETAKQETTVKKEEPVKTENKKNPPLIATNKNTNSNKKENTKTEVSKNETPKKEESVKTESVKQPEPVVVEKPVETPKVEVPVVEQPPVIQSENKFKNSIFIGDSIMVGLENYSKQNNTQLSEADFVAVGGISIWRMLSETIEYNGTQSTIEDIVVASGKKDIYISLGTNDLILYTPEVVADNLSKLYQKIINKVPDAKISIISTTYVVDNVTKENLNTSTVLRYNYLAKKFAERTGLNYINWAYLLNNNYGNLDAKYSTDNFVHLNNEAYKIYTDALIEAVK